MALSVQSSLLIQDFDCVHLIGHQRPAQTTDKVKHKKRTNKQTKIETISIIKEVKAAKKRKHRLSLPFLPFFFCQSSWVTSLLAEIQTILLKYLIQTMKGHRIQDLLCVSG